MDQNGVLYWLVLVLSLLTLSGCSDNRDVVLAGVSPAEGRVDRPASKSIVANCIVTFYKADGSIYLSEQRHTIYPESQGLEISGNEPGASFKWKLLGSKFRVEAGAENLDIMLGRIHKRNIAKLILTSVVTGSVVSAELDLSFQPAKLQGCWYDVIEVGPGSIDTSQALKSMEVPWATLKLYSDVSSGVIERVVIEDLTSGEMLMAHGYNFRWFDEIGRSIPTKIDIDKIATDRSEQQVILGIAYHTVRTL